MNYLLIVFLSVIIVILGSCATPRPPREEYAIAKAAMDAARLVESPRYSPDSWSRAELSFKRAENYFRNNEFDLARIEFYKARKEAEKSENATRVIRFKQGEVF